MTSHPQPDKAEGEYNDARHSVRSVWHRLYIYIFMNYGPGNIPNTMGSDSSTSGQAPLLLPFFFIITVR